MPGAILAAAVAGSILPPATIFPTHFEVSQEATASPTGTQVGEAAGAEHHVAGGPRAAFRLLLPLVLLFVLALGASLGLCRKTTSGTGNPTHRLEDRSKQETPQPGPKQLHVSGRSKMSKSELVRAIRKAS